MMAEGLYGGDLTHVLNQFEALWKGNNFKLDRTLERGILYYNPHYSLKRRKSIPSLLGK